MKTAALISMRMVSMTTGMTSMTLRSPKIICPMAPDHEIIAAESLYGADGSVYRLYEMNGSYGIYEVEND